MGVVTNIIIACHSENETMKQLQQWRYDPDVEGYVFNVVSVTDEKLPKDWYGGTKRLKCDLYIGAFNWLPLDELLRYMRSLKWNYPEGVQVIVMEEDDERFRIIDLFE